VEEAHRWSRGKGVRIAVIDSGIDLAHPDLDRRVALARDVSGRAAQAPVADVHGTAVAGIIAADAGNGVGIVGVAPEARLLALRACWQRAGTTAAVCDTLSLAQGIAVALAERADVINLSLTGPRDPLLERLLKRALAMGKIVVAAVPEEGAANEGFPASLDGVIAVASAETSAGRAVDASVLYAPGRRVLTLRPGGHYDFENGSSMATANVSGIAALVLALAPSSSAADIRRLLGHEAHWSATTELAAPPMVNACRALAAMTGKAQECGELRRMHATRR
jgi:subtilisin family serine protease